MLTLEKVKAYQHFNGDIDGYGRGGYTGGQAEITVEEWRLIDDLLQRLFLVATAQASAEFKRLMEDKLQQHTADEATRNLLRFLANDIKV